MPLGHAYKDEGILPGFSKHSNFTSLVFRIHNLSYPSAYHLLLAMLSLLVNVMGTMGRKVG
jgi:hypothetical protein